MLDPTGLEKDNPCLSGGTPSSSFRLKFRRWPFREGRVPFDIVPAGNPVSWGPLRAGAMGSGFARRDPYGIRIVGGSFGISVRSLSALMGEVWSGVSLTNVSGYVRGDPLNFNNPLGTPVATPISRCGFTGRLTIGWVYNGRALNIVDREITGIIDDSGTWLISGGLFWNFNWGVWNNVLNNILN